MIEVYETASCVNDSVVYGMHNVMLIRGQIAYDVLWMDNVSVARWLMETGLRFARLHFGAIRYRQGGCTLWPVQPYGWDWQSWSFQGLPVMKKKKRRGMRYRLLYLIRITQHGNLLRRGRKSGFPRRVKRARVPDLESLGVVRATNVGLVLLTDAMPLISTAQLPYRWLAPSSPTSRPKH